MPVELTPGQSKELNVELTPINGEFDPWYYDFDQDCYIDDDEVLAAAADYNAGKITRDQMQQVEDLWNYKTRNPACPPGGLSITRFIVFTRPEAGTNFGEWSMRCSVRNPTYHVATGTIHCTGELHRIKGAHIVPINEIHEFSVAARATHEYRLEDWQFLSTEMNDQCWVQLETSWGEITRPFWFRAGYHETGGVASMLAYDIEADKVSLRFARGFGEARRWEFSIRTPPTGTAEQLIEDVIENPQGDSHTSCYFYGKGLLSKRNYRAYGNAGGGEYYAQTDFKTK